MAKAPAFQFYVRDWISDPELSMASHTSKGIWIDLLCFMWESPVRGQVSGPVENIRKMVRATRSDFDHFLDQIASIRFGDVERDTDHVTLRNRRMFQQFIEKENNRLRVANFRAKQESNATSNGDVTPLSSSSTSSSELYTSNFLKFWSVYPRRVGKWKAFESWQRVASKIPLQKIIDAVVAQKKTEQWQRDGGKFIPHPTTWINQRRWEDECSVSVVECKPYVPPKPQVSEKERFVPSKEDIQKLRDKIGKIGSF